MVGKENTEESISRGYWAFYNYQLIHAPFRSLSQKLRRPLTGKHFTKPFKAYCHCARISEEIQIKTEELIHSSSLGCCSEHGFKGLEI